MIIVGGSYRERCFYPAWDSIYGSGGRAAVAISSLSPGSVLNTYAYKGWAADVRATMAGLGIAAHVVEIEEEIVFDYYYPLAKEYVPEPTIMPSITVAGEVVLSFGMLEGSATVTADRAVHDPQSSKPSAAFSTFGSKAGQLAYVVRDYVLMSKDRSEDPMDAVSRIMQDEGAAVVVVRQAVGGARVYIGETRPTSVPAYVSDTWFKIGSGDVFCAAFAHYWGERRYNPVDAADLASRCVAYFNDGHRLPLPPEASLRALIAQDINAPPGSVFLSGASSTLPQRWLLDEARSRLQELGNNVISPFHDHGERLDRNAARAVEDLARCRTLLAFVDGSDTSTNFHVGHARANDVMVVLLAEAVKLSDLTMFAGSDCEVAHDLATAIYRSHLASFRR